MFVRQWSRVEACLKPAILLEPSALPLDGIRAPNAPWLICASAPFAWPEKIVSILHGTQVLNTRRTPATFHRQLIVAVALTHPISRKTTLEVRMANDVGA